MQQSRQSGLTLIEIMISMAVLAFVLLAFMSIMSSASAFTESTRENLLASYELQSAAEDSLGGGYNIFITDPNWANGPTFTGLTTQGFCSTPSPSSHNLAKYWDTDPTHPRALHQEQVWMETISSTADLTSYRIHIRWKTNKNWYAESFVYMQRAPK
ncbi:MAG TPA: type II secretion system protein [Planctomycetota bacterium]|nr:type II secretion system protein [Planctomycetota bacterium]